MNVQTRLIQTSRSRPEGNSRPIIRRIDFDLTELENSEVWWGPPKPVVDFHTGEDGVGDLVRVGEGEAHVLGGGALGLGVAAVAGAPRLEAPDVEEAVLADRREFEALLFDRERLRGVARSRGPGRTREWRAAAARSRSACGPGARRPCRSASRGRRRGRGRSRTRRRRPCAGGAGAWAVEASSVYVHRNATFRNGSTTLDERRRLVQKRAKTPLIRQTWSIFKFGRDLPARRSFSARTRARCTGRARPPRRGCRGPCLRGALSTRLRRFFRRHDGASSERGRRAAAPSLRFPRGVNDGSSQSRISPSSSALTTTSSPLGEAARAVTGAPCAGTHRSSWTCAGDRERLRGAPLPRSLGPSVADERPWRRSARRPRAVRCLSAVERRATHVEVSPACRAEARRRPRAPRSQRRGPRRSSSRRRCAGRAGSERCPARRPGAPRGERACAACARARARASKGPRAGAARRSPGWRPRRRRSSRRCSGCGRGASAGS